MITKTIFTLLSAFLSFLKIPFFAIIAVIAIFSLISATYFFYLYFFKGFRLKKGEHNHVKVRSAILRLFWDTPRAYVRDIFNKDPEFFRYQGVVVFCGRQGSGKTVALTEFTRRMQKEYPNCRVLSNLDYKYQDDALEDWHQLIDYKNGIQGVIVQMDEMQNWFSSNQSKNFPPEMLEVITQNRKNRRIILGTSQVFCRLSKPLREQTTEVRDCYTFLGCITFVLRYEPVLNYEGIVEKRKYRGLYFFVHDDDLRNSYDTYKCIDSLSKSGFQEKVNQEIVISNNIK